MKKFKDRIEKSSKLRAKLDAKWRDNDVDQTKLRADVEALKLMQTSFDQQMTKMQEESEKLTSMEHHFKT